MHDACESTSWPATAVCDPINMFKQKNNWDWERSFSIISHRLHTSSRSIILFLQILFLNFNLFFNTIFVSSQMYPETCWYPSNRSLNEHEIYIRNCQESNSQPVPSQAGADTTRPQWRTLSDVDLK